MRAATTTASRTRDGWAHRAVHSRLADAERGLRRRERHGDPNHPEKTNFDNWQDNFRCAVSYSYCNRFHNGYAGWPTFSAWGAGKPIRIYAGEYSAYWKFWGTAPKPRGVTWGDARSPPAPTGISIPARR
jgi:hypothetical protein